MKTYKFKPLSARFSAPLSARLVLLGLLSLSSLSAQEPYLDEEDFYNEEINGAVNTYDPFESVNRYIFEFNDFFVLNIMQPIADGYTWIMPDPVEVGVSNFFSNLRYPVRFAGNLLQGRLKGAWVETGRFAINSTAGLAGVLAPADRLEGFAPIKPEDVGQAFGAWGIGEGPYLVLPFFGPSNFRDLGGLIGDWAVHPLRKPFSLVEDWKWEWRLALFDSEVIVMSPDIVKRYKQLKGDAIDPYSSIKHGYTQYRLGAIAE